MRRRLVICIIWLFFATGVALGSYEIVAKSPRLLGNPLPSWPMAFRAERATSWRQPTGLFALDKALHEGQEAALFYGMLLRIPVSPPDP